MTEAELAEWRKENPKSKAKYTTDLNSFSQLGLTHIKEKRFERKMGRSINVKKDTRATLWGNFLEQRVYNLLPNTYEIIGQDQDSSIFHQTIKNWCGKPDLKDTSRGIVSDIKCLEPLMFGTVIEDLSKGYEVFKNEHPDKFWQLISNSILTGMPYIELIPYMPYRKELPEIRKDAYDYEGWDKFKYKFIYEAADEELPYLADDSEYKNLNQFVFEAKKEDQEFLTERVKKAVEVLNG